MRACPTLEPVHYENMSNTKAFPTVELLLQENISSMIDFSFLLEKRSISRNTIKKDSVEILNSTI
jgi:hypothetical protein